MIIDIFGVEFRFMNREVHLGGLWTFWNLMARNLCLEIMRGGKYLEEFFT